MFYGIEGVVAELFEGLVDEVRAELGESIVEGCGGIEGKDGEGCGIEDVACIHALGECDDGDACLLFVTHDGVVDGGGTTIFGEERGVEVYGEGVFEECGF